MANQLYQGSNPLATTCPKDASELPYSNGVSVKDKIDDILNDYKLTNIASFEFGTSSDHRFYILGFINEAKTDYLRIDFQTDYLRFRYFVNSVQQFERYVDMKTPQ